MSASEAFTMISASKHAGPQLFESYLDGTSGRLSDQDVQLITALRSQYPELIVTAVPGNNVNLLAFAAAGNASFELENTQDDPIIRWLGYVPANHRNGEGHIGEARFFAKYHYTHDDVHFILYVVTIGYSRVQYVLTEPRNGETTLDNSAVTGRLVNAIGKWQSADEDVVYVFDGFWMPSKSLWKQVQAASWDKIILDSKLKKALTDVSSKFFDSEDVYEELGVPWKRGLIFHGPVGDGKTSVVKALMHTLYQRSPKIPSLYVKSAANTYAISEVFRFARAMTPCLLILEDIETIVTQSTRSYFFNEADGLEGNDGILMIATTNYLDRLDPGLSKRPSRFDRKYLFPQPNLEQRTQYCCFWRNKLKAKPNIGFPKVLCRAIAKLMDGFSFAYMQEAFVSTLLVLARGGEDDESLGEDVADKGDKSGDDGDDDDDDLDSYEFYRVMKKQIKILRKDMDSGDGSSPDRLPDEAEDLRKSALDSSMFMDKAVSRNGSTSKSACAYMPGDRSGGMRAPTESIASFEGHGSGRREPVTMFRWNPEDAIEGMSKIRDLKESVYAYCPKS